MKTITKRIIIGLGGVIALSVICFIGFIAYVQFVVFDYPFDNKDFDKKVWSQFHDSKDPDNPRGEMIEDLQSKYLKLDLKKSEVINLLGEPDFSKTETLWMYNLGMWSGFRIDYDCLYINFENNKLVSSRRVQH